MKDIFEVSPEEAEDYYEQIKEETESAGYNLNPDKDFCKELLASIIINKRRYGYGACPCRLASGDKDKDMDIICPCDYRDADITEHGACYCGLYVSEAILKGKEKLKSIPERRPPEEEREKISKHGSLLSGELPLPVWRCRVCGYLCARNQPPDICPICKVEKERFERFI